VADDMKANVVPEVVPSVPAVVPVVPPPRVVSLHAGVKTLVPLQVSEMLLAPVPAVLAVIVKSPSLGLFAVAFTPMLVLHWLPEASTVAMPEAQLEEVPLEPLAKVVVHGVPPLVQVPLVLPLSFSVSVFDPFTITSEDPLLALAEKLPLALAAVGALASRVALPMVRVELLLTVDEPTVPTVIVALSSAPSKPALQSFSIGSPLVRGGFLNAASAVEFAAFTMAVRAAKSGADARARWVMLRFNCCSL
jgi:hypothetical protein